jgi:putative transposase
MKAISFDLRSRIIEALEAEPSSLKVAERFKVSGSSVRKLRLKLERTGDFAAGHAPGRERLVKGKDEKKLRRLVEKYPDATLVVLCELLADETKLEISETTMWRQLQRMGLTLKKNPSTHRNGIGRM